MKLRLLAVVVLLSVAGCSAEQPSSPAPTTYELPPRQVRPDETALKLPPAKNGDTEFALLGLAAGLPSITGSHTEFPAKGQFVRLRLVVTNTGTSSVLFDTGRQLLVDDQGVAHPPEQQAMVIKRQPRQFDLGHGVRVEFDLYWDIPRDRKPAALRAFGGPTITDMKNATGTDIKL
ncbi:DUF4352 domain-containing protein [Amycolatopsis rifamycinica]|uniref:Uncharacterized protein n=1 Tax=Amycolatopsis rifamycinica TaxID=287986 RepID=A0A066UBV2_9PSEU|nr:DUF4352 domain-containing protein [Amycolatopsis rifamycinica]KDN21599.1 hypothetical protein DV20_14060 [Amycolatopsis rifamycinica]